MCQLEQRIREICHICGERQNYATTAAETMEMQDNIQFRITFDETTLAGWTGTIKSGFCQSVVITSPACIESRVPR